MGPKSGKGARIKGQKWERACRKYLDRWIVSRQHVGSDEPDIVLDVNGVTISVECKDQARLAWPEWLRQADTDRRKVGADLSIVLAKRAGKTMVGSAYVMMTADDFQWLLTRLELVQRTDVD